MGYAVHYRDAVGGCRLEDVDSLEAAVELVERLRNEDSASEVRAFREVALEVRTYFKVVALEQEAGVGRSSEPPPGAMPLSPPVSVHAEPVSSEDLAVEARRSGLFQRG
jgi:hypothetical protein